MSPQPAPSTAAVSAPVRRKPRYYAATAVAVAAAIAISIVVFWWQSRIPPFQKIVVRPLTLESGPPWLAGAITEEISTAFDRQSPQSAPGATAVLEGTVAKQGDRVRIVARLSRPDGHLYWTRTLDWPLNQAAL